MSNTIVDMPKVTQTLDSGWIVQMERGGMSGYIARARHERRDIWDRARKKIKAATIASGMSEPDAEAIMDIDFDEPGVIDTDDFTPEQALTRLAYKVHGEIIQ